jgi:hypothetical protein
MTRSITRGTALILSLAVLLLAGLGTAGTATAAPPQTGSITTDIAGTVDGVAKSGTLEVTRFVVRNGELLAQGTLSGFTPTPQAVAIPVNTTPTAAAAATGTCEILNLVLGPLDLDLLGLVVHLDQVVLNITAQQGPGNLLGNLLCAVAGLLDNTGAGAGGGILNGIAALLNQILGALG